MPASKQPRPKLEDAVSALSGEVGRLARVVDNLTSLVGRIVFPVEAMNELVGELRALRHLLDKDGEFRQMDRNRARAMADGKKPEAGKV